MKMAEEHSVLNREKILNILESIEGTRLLDITSCWVRPGTGPGENFASEMLACDVTAVVDGVEKKHHWMVKLQLEQTVAMEGMKLEEKEIQFYMKVIPAWKQLAREKGASFSLNCFDAVYAEFHPEDDNRSFLVMQNLKMLGYSDPKDKKKGLGNQYLRLALEEMARFHALGRVHVKSHPDGDEGFIKSWEPMATDYMYIIKPARYRSVEPALAEGMGEIVAAVQDPGEDLFERYNRFHQEKGFFSERDAIHDTRRDGFNVICHGDSWFSNVLFKHDNNGEPERATWIDISMTRWASPCTDLATFLHSATPADKEQFDELLKHYHSTLMTCLKELGDDTKYPFEQLLLDFDRCALAGFWVSYNVLPFALATAEEAKRAYVWGDKEEEYEATKRITDEDASIITKLRFKKAARLAGSNPHTKMMLRGICLDMVRRGVF